MKNKITFLMLALLTPFVLILGQERPENLIKLSFSLWPKEKNEGAVLGIFYQNKNEWHTYWKNPGDAGTPFHHQFINNKKENIALYEYPWPAPQIFKQGGDLLGYGYNGTYGLFYRLTPRQLSLLKSKGLTLKTNFLICRHICVPGQYTAQFKMKENALQVISLQPSYESFHLSENKKQEFFRLLPMESSSQKETSFKIAFDEKEKKIYVFYKATSLANQKQNIAFFYPSDLFTFKDEKIIQLEDTSKLAMQSADWDGEYLANPVSFPRNIQEFHALAKQSFHFKALLLSKGQYHDVEIKADEFQLQENFQQTKKLFSKSSHDAVKKIQIKSKKSLFGELLFFLLLSYLGGIILNFMPCVLPVISLKLFSLIESKKLSKKKILLHNLTYSSGIFATLFSMALVVVLLQYFGHEVGWGFHLQSPHFVGAMLIILLLITLNLFGLYEIKTPGGQVLAGVNVDSSKSFKTDFINGVITTLLATPCSAPFLGTALAFAFTQGGMTIISCFLAIAFGLATPFLIIGFFPSTVVFLPKPGHWMEHLKKFLAVLLLLTMIWLMDVYSALVDNDSFLVMLLNLIFVILFFTIYFVKKISHKKFLQLPFYLFSLFLLVLLPIKLSEFTFRDHSGLEKGELSFQTWSHEKMEEAVRKRKTLFIDFTAKWCFTCKINEKMVLQTTAFRQLVKKYNLELAIGDWTKKDETITTFLQQNGVSGVPAYFIQDKEGRLHKLSELLTIDEIEAKLRSLDTSLPSP